MQPTVLFVDDEQRVTQAMQRALSGEPFRVLTAASGPEALALLEREHVDVIVADEKMPGMRGSELLRQVHDQHPAIVRIILTGQATLEQAINAINTCEIHRFFTKPTDDRELAKALQAAIEKKLLEQDAKNLLHVLETGLDPSDSIMPPGSPATTPNPRA